MNMLSHFGFAEHRTSLFLLFDTYDAANRISHCTFARSPSMNILYNISGNKIKLFFIFSTIHRNLILTFSIFQCLIFLERIIIIYNDRGISTSCLYS